MKQIFKPEDFNHTIYRDMTHDQIMQVYCDAANFKINQLIESWPMVHSTNPCNFWVKDTIKQFVDPEMTHKARLAFIEEIVKEPCTHRPAMSKIGNDPWTLSTNKDGQIYCSACMISLNINAVWKEKI
jgi:hypothetical protein